MIRLRNPKTDDPVIFELVRTELLPLSYTYHAHEAQAVRELPKKLRSGITYVAARGSLAPPEGFIHIEPMGEILYLDMLVVRRSSRNKGLGRRLIAAGDAYGLAHGCITARLFVDDSNPRAHRFYEKLGYFTTGYFHESRCYEMLKRLVF